MRDFARHALVIVYIPLSCALAGWLAYAGGCEVPGVGDTGFAGVFWTFALPLPGYAGLIRAPSLAVGFGCLLLLHQVGRGATARLRLTCIRTLLAVVAILVLLPYKVFWEILYPAMGPDLGWSVSTTLTQLFHFAQMLIDPLLAGVLSLLPVFTPRAPSPSPFTVAEVPARAGIRASEAAPTTSSRRSFLLSRAAWA